MKEEKPEREKERKRKYFLNERGERNLIKYLYIYIYLALSHCSNEGKKKKRYSSITG